MNTRMTFAALAVAAAAFVGLGSNSAQAGGCYGGYCHTPIYNYSSYVAPVHYNTYSPYVNIYRNCHGHCFFNDGYGLRHNLLLDSYGRYYFYQNSVPCYVSNYNIIGY